MNIIFMGTAEFAVPSLTQLLHSEDHNVVAVFTQTPKAKNRGLHIVKSPIYQLADKYNILVYTPKTLKTPESYEMIDNINADVIIVVAYGFIIPGNIINAKKYGCLNIHPSKLPKYRGAAPLQHTIINGDKETAICIIQMDEGLDTGDIIMQQNIELNPRVTLQELHDDTARIGSDILIKLLNNIENLPRIPQSSDGMIYATKLSKDNGRVDWEEKSFSIDCKIRGMNPWPGVYFDHLGVRIKILSAEYTNNKHDTLPGTIMNNNFEIACGEGTLILKSIKPEGKSQMSAIDYLHGIK